MGKMGAGNIKFNGCFHNMPWGLQTHIYAPMNVDLRNKYRIAGNQPGFEPPEPIEMGLKELGAPSEGLYLHEDIEIKCNVTMVSFVKSQLQKAGGEMVKRIIKKAELLDAGVLQGMMDNGKLKTFNPADRSNTGTLKSSPLPSPTQLFHSPSVSSVAPSRHSPSASINSTPPPPGSPGMPYHVLGQYPTSPAAGALSTAVRHTVLRPTALHPMAAMRTPPRPTDKHPTIRVCRWRCRRTRRHHQPRPSLPTRWPATLSPDIPACSARARRVGPVPADAAAELLLAASAAPAAGGPGTPSLGSNHRDSSASGTSDFNSRFSADPSQSGRLSNPDSRPTSVSSLPSQKNGFHSPDWTIRGLLVRASHPQGGNKRSPGGGPAETRPENPTAVASGAVQSCRLRQDRGAAQAVAKEGMGSKLSDISTRDKVTMMLT